MGLRHSDWDNLVSNVGFSPLNSVAYCWYYRGPLIYSYVIQDLSWQMGFWFVAIPLGICLILVFFFVPEVHQSILFCDLTMVSHCYHTDYLYSCQSRRVDVNH